MCFRTSSRCSPKPDRSGEHGLAPSIEGSKPEEVRKAKHKNGSPAVGLRGQGDQYRSSTVRTGCQAALSAIARAPDAATPTVNALNGRGFSALGSADRTDMQNLLIELQGELQEDHRSSIRHDLEISQAGGHFGYSERRFLSSSRRSRSIIFF